MNRIVEAQEYLEQGGEAAPCMDSLFQAEHGLLGPEEAPSLSAVEPAPTSSSSSSRVSVFTLETIQSFPKARSRIGALYFSAQRQRMCCRDLAGFAQHVAELIQIHQKAVTYGFGFHLRYYTFFAIPGGDAWVVLASTHPLAMRKWYKVFVGLKAVDIRVPHATRQARIPPCESLLNVAEIFQGATTVEELARNRVDCTDPEPAGGKPRSKQGKRQGSSSSSSKETASQPEKEDAPPETDGESQVRVFPYASDFISDACLQFLRSTEWPDVMPVWSMIEQHLQQLKRPDQGQTARFILSPRPLEQFARAVHLRHAVHLVLETWNIRVASLSHADVSSSEGYHGLSQKSRAVLRGVGALFDSDSCFPVFAFLDKTSVVSFLCMHIVESNARTSKDRGAKEKDFFETYMAPVLEQSWWLTAAACRMSAFLLCVREDGVSSVPGWCEAWLLDPAVDERKHLEDSLHEYPTLSKVVAANPQRDFAGCRKKLSFWNNKAKHMVAGCRKAAGGKLGVAGEMLQTVLDNTKFFYEMLPDHRGFQCLPVAGQGAGDPQGLVQCMCQSRGV